MRADLMFPTDAILDEIASGCTQKQLVLTYAMAITSSEQTDWGRVNRAIIERWSVSGFVRVKTMAWKLVELRSANGAA